MTQTPVRIAAAVMLIGVMLHDWLWFILGAVVWIGLGHIWDLLH